MAETEHNGPPLRHAVAIIGGSTSAAEVAEKLAERGAVVVVFEQNARPYGKIEDGLPRWHIALRKKEYRTIGGKLGRENVHYVPLTKVGRDVCLDEVARDWGFSAIVLACGAWRDRALAVEGADDYVGKGLVYQNPFIFWFNHANQKDYAGPRFEVEDGVLVVGGGLASIDVVKVLMLESARLALAKRGIEVAMLELEVKGIPKILAAHGLAWEDLGLEGCTLFYRRRIEDMPLVEIPEGADEKRTEKMRAARRKLLDKAMEKYRFKVEPLSMPDGLLVEGDRLVGLRLRRTRIEGGRVIPMDETYERRGPYVISSIGSIPEPLAGVPMKGELFQFSDWELGRLDGYPTLFSAGNVVTGKGNIVASRKHGSFIAEHVAERFLGLSEEGHAGEESIADAAAEAAGAVARQVASEIEAQPPIDPETLAAILARVAARQRAVGYDGDYKGWIERVTPPDLE
jgi:NADPH-dependent glutamate synthase beta subunit-like oxidoreductase